MDILEDNEYWAEKEREEQARELEATRKGPGPDATEADWDAYYARCEAIVDRQHDRQN